MARPSTKELTKRATRLANTVTDKEDPHALRALTAFKRRLYKRFVKDADFWYEAMVAVVLFPSKDHTPMVKMLTDVLRSAVPEQRTFPTKPADEQVRPPMTVNIICPPGMEVQRGTAPARQASIDAQVTKRQLTQQRALEVVGEIVPPAEAG